MIQNVESHEGEPPDDDSETPAQRPDARWEFAIAECRRSLDVQVRDLDAVRARAGGLITLSVAVVTFVAGAFIAKKGGDLTCASWAGFASLALAIGMGIDILRPRTFSFALDLDYVALMAANNSVNGLLESAAGGYRENKQANQQTLDGLHTRYSVGLVAVSLGAGLMLAGVAFR